MSRKFFVSESSCTQVDPTTGELYTYSNKKEIVKVETEPFFFTYSRQIIALFGKSSISATIQVLWKLLEIAEWNTGKVYMNKERREEIMKECNISRPSFDRAIKELTNMGVVDKAGSLYTINELMFWKGNREGRKKLIDEARMKVTFTPVFKESTLIEYNEDKKNP